MKPGAIRKEVDPDHCSTARSITAWSPRKRELKALTKAEEPLTLSESNNGTLDLAPSYGTLDQEASQEE